VALAEALAVRAAEALGVLAVRAAEATTVTAAKVVAEVCPVIEAIVE
jgi:hypothetical protein